uniref:Uncharacterized protein LOC100179198 n=1 Tax=Phallusia mammillata TaxID=59560 RepID=A0A6F9DHQ8_9ASCI|nr:uncharacterized protein LOC100179198 [Phallusia mammillata]
MHRFAFTIVGCIILLQLVSCLNAAAVSQKTPINSPESNKKNITSPHEVISDETKVQNNATTENDQKVPHTVVSWTKENMGMLKRGFYVLLVLTAIIALYFGVRIYRTRNRKVKKYGLLSSGGGERIGLNPIDSDSEDDYTVFETKTLH